MLLALVQTRFHFNNMPDVTAPGARIVCRDAEWLVKSSSLSSGGDRVIEAIGVSEFIRGKSARFLQELEQDNLQILLPEETALVSNTSAGYRHSLLFLEAQLRQTAPNDGRIYTGSQAAMDLLPYQLRPAYDALQKPRQHILIAEHGVGGVGVIGALVDDRPLNRWSQVHLILSDVSEEFKVWSIAQLLPDEIPVELTQAIWATPGDWQKITEHIEVLAGDGQPHGPRPQERMVFHWLDSNN